MNVTKCYMRYSMGFESLLLQEVHFSGRGRAINFLSFDRKCFTYSFLRKFITVTLMPVGIFRYLTFAKYTQQWPKGITFRFYFVVVDITVIKA
jgi:hypothetical protein